MLGIDVVVVEELSGHGSLYQNLFVVLDKMGVKSLRGLVVGGSQRLLYYFLLDFRHW